MITAPVVIILGFLVVVILSLVQAITTNYTWEGPNDNWGPTDCLPNNRHTGRLPDDDVEGLLSNRMVEMGDTNNQKIKLATDATLHWRGILTVSQRRKADLTWDYDTSLTYTIQGPVRGVSNAAIDPDDYLCCAALGTVRTWVFGVDPAGAVIGQASGSCTLANEMIEFVITGGR